MQLEELKNEIDEREYEKDEMGVVVEEMKKSSPSCEPTCWVSVCIICIALPAVCLVLYRGVFRGVLVASP